VSQTNVVPPRAPEGARFRPRPKPLTKPQSVTTPIATAAFAQIRNCHHGHADGLCLSRHHVLNTWTIAGSRHLLLFCLLFPKRVKTKHGQQPRLPQSRPQRSYFAPFPIRRVTRRNRKISLTNAQSQKKNCPIPLFLFPSAPSKPGVAPPPDPCSANAAFPLLFLDLYSKVSPLQAPSTDVPQQGMIPNFRLDAPWP
jgi:hypothetical protein